MISCLHPVRVRLKDTDSYIFVPCGHCINCVNRRVNDWVFRLKQEMKYSLSGCFATFTVRDSDLDECHKDPKGVFQRFIKRLRKNCPYDLSKTGFKYFCTSELGHDKGRLHYHVLFFNYLHDFWDFQKYLTRCWKHGIVWLENISEKKIHYVCKYMLNSLFNSRGRHIKVDVSSRSDRKVLVDRYIKPFSWYFSLKSQRIGYSMFTKSMVSYLYETNGIITVPPYRTGASPITFALPRQLYIQLCKICPEMTSPEKKDERLNQILRSSRDYSFLCHGMAELESRKRTGEITSEICDSNKFIELYFDRLLVLKKSDRNYSKLFNKLKFVVPPLCDFSVPLKYRSQSEANSTLVSQRLSRPSLVV